MMEVIVAIAIATLILTGAVSFFGAIDKQGRQAATYGDCADYLKESFASIEQVGNRGIVDSSFLPHTNGGPSFTAVPYSFPSGFDPYMSMTAMGFSNPSNYALSLGSLVIDPTNSFNTQLNSPAMLAGTPQFLHAIVRANPSICSTAQTYDKVTVTSSKIFPAPGRNLTESGDFLASIRLRPLGIGVDCNDPNQMIAPVGNQDLTASGVSTSGIPVYPNITPTTWRFTNFNSHVVRGGSIAADISVSYTKKGDSSPTTCQETRTYKFPADTTSPIAPPTYSFVVGGSNASCDTITPTLGRRIGPHFVKFQYPAPPTLRYEPGITLFCRDRSFQEQNHPNCAPTYIYQPIPTPNRWTACEAVTVCGYHRDFTTNGAPQFTGPKMDQVLQFAELPRGCRVQLDVVAVDTAGNFSPMVTITSSAISVP